MGRRTANWVAIVEQTKEQIRRRKREDNFKERRGDMLEAMKSLTFLMKADIDRRESLDSYLKFMDCVLDKMTREEFSRAS